MADTEEVVVVEMELNDVLAVRFFLLLMKPGKIFFFCGEKEASRYLYTNERQRCGCSAL